MKVKSNSCCKSNTDFLPANQKHMKGKTLGKQKSASGGADVSSNCSSSSCLVGRHCFLGLVLSIGPVLSHLIPVITLMAGTLLDPLTDK